MRGELLEVAQRAGWQKIIDEGECGDQASRQRGVVVGSDKGAQPDEAVTAPLQTSNLILQHRWIATVPAIGDDEDHRLIAEHGPCPALMKSLQ
jgi:hypothetical protein